MNTDGKSGPQPPRPGDKVLVERQHLASLFQALVRRDYQVIGPTIREGAIVHDRLNSPDDLPAGWTEDQDAGRYRLQRRNDDALFGFASGPHSWKIYLLPPNLRLFAARRDENGMTIAAEPSPVPRQALLGMRACDLQSLAALDRVLSRRALPDTDYQARRKNLFIVAVNCGKAGGTCFCASMDAGPRAHFGFDLALTELLTGERHYFLVETGTDRGAEVLAEVPHAPAGQTDFAAAERVINETRHHMGRVLDPRGLKEVLYRNYDNPRWEDVGARCLACASCTMVCPTCYCYRIEDTTDLTGQRAERRRRWDSCFTLAFSQLNGGQVRQSVKSRYRHWLTHKLATWHDQFGGSGCVGCGRCITWCPVGIDLTEEIRNLRESEPLQARELANPIQP